MRQPEPITRRQFLKLAAKPAVQIEPGNLSQPFPFVTPIGQFFRQQLRHIPQIHPRDWLLTVGGAVSKAAHFTYSDLLAFPAHDLYCTLICAGNRVGGPLMGNGLWRGVPLREILLQAEAATDARYVQFHALDGYVTSVALEHLRDAVIAYKMNGAPLPYEHGFPARLIAPDLYGYKMPKWIRHIEVADTPVIGFWEGRGWSQTGTVQTTAVILSPRQHEPVSGTVSFAGIAYAGNRAIMHIEISIDDGPWMPVSFSPAPYSSWTRWHIHWNVPTSCSRPAQYLVKVRACDEDGFTQRHNLPAHPFPNHSNSIHSVVIRVME